MYPNFNLDTLFKVVHNYHRLMNKHLVLMMNHWKFDTDRNVSFDLDSWISSTNIQLTEHVQNMLKVVITEGRFNHQDDSIEVKIHSSQQWTTLTTNNTVFDLVRLPLAQPLDLCHIAALSDFAEWIGPATSLEHKNAIIQFHNPLQKFQLIDSHSFHLPSIQTRLHVLLNHILQEYLTFTNNSSATQTSSIKQTLSPALKASVAIMQYGQYTLCWCPNNDPPIIDVGSITTNETYDFDWESLTTFGTTVPTQNEFSLIAFLNAIHEIISRNIHTITDVILDSTKDIWFELPWPMFKTNFNEAFGVRWITTDLNETAPESH